MATVEVVEEPAHVRARRRDRADAVALARHYATALGLLVADGDDLARGLGIFERHPALGASDAVLAAAALNHGVDALVSADRAFGEVGELVWVDPATAALDALLR